MKIYINVDEVSIGVKSINALFFLKKNTFCILKIDELCFIMSMSHKYELEK